MKGLREAKQRRSEAGTSTNRPDTFVTSSGQRVRYCEWPGQENLKALASRCLLIYAQTVSVCSDFSSIATCLLPPILMENYSAQHVRLELDLMHSCPALHSSTPFPTSGDQHVSCWARPWSPAAVPPCSQPHGPHRFSPGLQPPAHHGAPARGSPRADISPE